jgi:hypothetical protein
MAAVLVMASPVIFAAPAAAPSHYNYLAAAFHIVAQIPPTIAPATNTPGFEIDATNTPIGTAAPFPPTNTPVIGITRTPSPGPAPTITPTRDPVQCAAEYPTVCIPPPPPDLNCPDITFRNFTVLPPDRHHFDTDKDGIGCEQ